MPVFALVDCNNFYASCEKLFDPTIRDTPIVVLSNNDGCVVARSAESKALGVPMGAPWFQIQEIAKTHGIRAFSSNYALYADMSNRVVEVLSQFSPNLEVYSIDESFLDLSGFTHLDLVDYGQQIRKRVSDWLGMPVCVGIAPSKTLAKLANHIAKKRSAYSGVCDLTRCSESELIQLLAEIEVGEVWGIGRQLKQRLNKMGIVTVRDLRDADASQLRQQISVVLERTVRELRGVACLELEEVAPAKQQIMVSRSFGNYVYTVEALAESVSAYVSRAAEKLRRQHSLAGAVSVYVRTNPFKPKDPQYQRTVTMPLAEPTADTMKLTHAALQVLKYIFKSGYAYQKSGIILTDLCPENCRQVSLFAEPEKDNQSKQLMATLDRINQKFGRSTIRLLSEGSRKDWHMRREKLSPSYTTNWAELPVVKAR